MVAFVGDYSPKYYINQQSGKPGRKKTTLTRTPNVPIPHLRRNVQQYPEHPQALGYATDITFSNPQINPLRPQKVILRFQTLFPKTLQQPLSIQK